MSLSDVDVTPPATAQHVFIARQPIFDAQETRVAYELLYRATREATRAYLGEVSPSLMCGDTALHALLSIGLDRLTHGAVAYMNVTEEHLLGELYKIFDPAAVVLELLETVEGTPAVVDACRRAVADGYTLALDDYDGRASLDALLPFVKVVKVDVLDRDVRVLGPWVARLRERGLTVLAERVETQEALAAARAIGCTLFQGYVFSRPETLDGRSVNVHQAAVLQIVGLLNEPDATDNALEEAFRSHPSLSLSLLRIVNSAAFGGRGVDSIPHALQLIGREALSRWMLIMLVATVAHVARSRTRRWSRRWCAAGSARRSRRAAPAGIRRLASCWDCCRAWTRCSVCPWCRCLSACPSAVTCVPRCSTGAGRTRRC